MLIQSAVDLKIWILFYELRRVATRLFYDYRWMPRQSTPTSLFGRRLREARNRVGIAQDKLGVVIGMDESCSSARISRYETGIHEPPVATAKKLAAALSVPLAFFYCEDDCLAEIIIMYGILSESQKNQLLHHARDLMAKSGLTL